jgi:hypothetical protein
MVAQKVEVATKEELRAELEKFKDGNIKFDGGNYTILLTTPAPYTYDLSDYDLSLKNVGTPYQHLSIIGKENIVNQTVSYQLKLKTVKVVDGADFTINLGTVDNFWKEGSDPSDQWVEIVGTDKQNPTPDNIIYRNDSWTPSLNVAYRSRIHIKGLKTTKAFIEVYKNSELILMPHRDCDVIGFINVSENSKVTGWNVKIDTIIVQNKSIALGSWLSCGESLTRNMAGFTKPTTRRVPTTYVHSDSLFWMGLIGVPKGLTGRGLNTDHTYTYMQYVFPKHNSYRDRREVRVDNSRFHIGFPQALYADRKTFARIDHINEDGSRHDIDVTKEAETVHTIDPNNNQYQTVSLYFVDFYFANHTFATIHSVLSMGPSAETRLGKIEVEGHSSFYYNSKENVDVRIPKITVYDFAYFYSNARRNHIAEANPLSIAQVSKLYMLRGDAVDVNKYKFVSADLVTE